VATFRLGAKTERRRFTATLVGAAMSFAAGAASGEPSAADRAAAESLFQDGRRLLEAGDVATACVKFAESQRLAPALGSLLNLAACHEREGKIASAWIEFSEAATLSERAGESERAAFATERANALARELATVTVTVRGTEPGRVVTLDEREVRAATFGTAIPIDPGEHVVKASAPGKAPFVRTFSVARGRSATSIEVPELSAAAPPISKPATTAAAGATATPSAANAEPAQPELWPLLVTGGVGVAGMAVGTVFGLKTFAEKETVDRECPPSEHPYCSSEGLAANERAHDAALISTIGFGVGAVAGAAFTYLFFSGRETRASSQASVATSIGRDHAHVVGRCTF
jgi:hypothetical protein